MASCERFLPHFSDYLEGTIPIQLKAEFEAHLRSCESCQGVLQRMKVLQAQMQQLPRVRTSNAFHIVLRSRIRHEMERPTVWERIFDSFQGSRWPAYAAAAVLVLAISYGSVRFLFRTGTEVSGKSAVPTSLLGERRAPGAVVVQKPGGQVEERIHFILDEVPASLLLNHGQSLSSEGLRAFRSEEQISREDSVALTAGHGGGAFSVRKAATVTF